MHGVCMLLHDQIAGGGTIQLAVAAPGSFRVSIPESLSARGTGMANTTDLPPCLPSGNCSMYRKWLP